MLKSLVKSYWRSFDGLRFVTTASVAAVFIVAAIYGELDFAIYGADRLTTGY